MICSIDPPGCVDIDDAVHAMPLGGGRFEIGVHIADVTHFIQPDSALDLEAAKRGETFYMVSPATLCHETRKLRTCESCA
eukprot:2527712-Pleurochrysis_carterae.AAC.1